MIKAINHQSKEITVVRNEHRAPANREFELFEIGCANQSGISRRSRLDSPSLKAASDGVINTFIQMESEQHCQLPRLRRSNSLSADRISSSICSR